MKFGDARGSAPPLSALCLVLAKRRCGNAPRRRWWRRCACENEVVDRTCVCLLCVSLICVRHGIKARCASVWCRGCLCEHLYIYLCIYICICIHNCIHERYQHISLALFLPVTCACAVSLFLCLNEPPKFKTKTSTVCLCKYAYEKITHTRSLFLSLSELTIKDKSEHCVCV